MYVDTATYERSGKIHKRYLLRASYRENGKVKKKTIASLCSLSASEISSLKLALKHKSDLSTLTSIKNAKIEQGINPPIKYRIYLLQIASDCNIIFGCQKKKILGNYQ